MWTAECHFQIVWYCHCFFYLVPPSRPSPPQTSLFPAQLLRNAKFWCDCVVVFMAEGFDNYMVLAVYDDVLVYTESCSFTYRFKKKKKDHWTFTHACMHAHTLTHTQKLLQVFLSLIRYCASVLFWRVFSDSVKSWHVSCRTCLLKDLIYVVAKLWSCFSSWK